LHFIVAKDNKNYNNKNTKAITNVSLLEIILVQMKHQKNSFITFTQKIKSVRFNILQNALT